MRCVVTPSLMTEPGVTERLAAATLQAVSGAG
jgi:aspartate-semialdehyde dehydrogenase